MFWPGSFIQRNSSAKLLAGKVGRPAKVEAAVLIRPMVTKFFSASKFRFGYSDMPAASATWWIRIV